MPRPVKEGLDYFELDCHMDEKVRMIQAEFGLKGFAVVVLLFMEIYGDKGYYMSWDKDRLLLFALENGSTGDGKNLIQEIVQACIRRNIFSEELFKKYGILTSSGIQRRYINATSRREGVKLKKEYLLIDVDKNSVSVDNNSVNVDRNSINVDSNSQSREEKIRVDNSYSASIIDNPAREDPEPVYPLPDPSNDTIQIIMDAWNEIPHVIKIDGIFPMSQRYENLRFCINMVGIDGILEAIQKIAESEYFRERGSVQFERYIKPDMIQKVLEGTYDKSFRKGTTKKQNAEKTRFNNFSQREYDYAELEKQLRNKDRRAE